MWTRTRTQTQTHTQTHTHTHTHTHTRARAHTPPHTQKQKACEEDATTAVALTHPRRILGRDEDEEDEKQHAADGRQTSHVVDDVDSEEDEHGRHNACVDRPANTRTFI